MLANFRRAILWGLFIAIALALPVYALVLNDETLSPLGLGILVLLPAPVALVAALFVRGVDAVLIGWLCAVLAWLPLWGLLGIDVLGVLVYLSPWLVAAGGAGAIVGVIVRRVVRSARPPAAES